MKGKIRRLIVNFILLILLIVSIIFCVSSGKFNISTSSNEDSTITSLELPEILSEQPQEIAQHVGYTVSFNSDWRIPNWVAYELTAEEVQGVVPRGNDFVPDPVIASGTPSSDDYKNSGYDRGHMAPAADMKWSEQAMAESFYTSNICPQNKNLNKGDWKALEEHVRSIATKYDHIYIACGPIVAASPKNIGYGHSRIAIPDAFYKVILRQNGDSWSAIGFMMPNKAGHKPLKTYVKSVNELEEITEINFFVALPDSIEETIENTCNLKDWNL